jgi:aerobic carbon-monoxide dehydrogenase medium subunit
LIQEHCPIVSHTAGQVGDPQVRHRGTIGGSLAHCDPASDFPAVILALDAELVIAGPEGERTVPAAEFFRGVFDSALTPAELLTEIRVPKLGAWTGWSYRKFTRRAQDWATVGVAALVRRDNGSVGDVRVALTNMGATPLRATSTEDAILAGEEDPARHVAEGASPPTDTSASAEFRAHLAHVVGRRAIEEAMQR